MTGSGAMADLGALRDRYVAALLRGDRREAVRVIGEGFEAGASVLELQLEVIQEAQREVGRLWQEDRIGTAQEHVATAISQVALAHLYERAPAAPPNGNKVVLACVEGELHDFPARICADALDLAGFEVAFLGASVPVDALARFVAIEKPHLLALSVTMTFNVPKLRESVACIHAIGEARPLVAVGGHACTWGKAIARDVGADLSGRDAAELVEGARRILERG